MQRQTLFLPCASFFEDPFGARRIEDAAGTEAGQVRHRLLRRAAAFLHPVDHLLRERSAHHPVPAHGGQLQHVFVRQVLGLALEPERIADAVAAGIRRVAALLGAVDRSRDIDAQTEVRLPSRLSRNPRPPRGCRTPRPPWSAYPGRRSPPRKSGVMSRFQCDAGFIDCDGRSAPPWRASPRFTGLKRQRHLQELLQLGNRILVVLAAASRSRKRRSRRESSRRRRSDAVYWSSRRHLRLPRGIFAADW